MDNKDNIDNYFSNDFILANSDISLKRKNNNEIILNHLDSKYFRNDNINKEDLKEDLEEDIIIFKSYRDYLEYIQDSFDSFLEFLTFSISFCLGVIASDIKAYIPYFICILILFIVVYFFKVYRGSKRSKTYKILTINKLIYKLENIEKNYSYENTYKELIVTNSEQKPSIKTKIDKYKTYTQKSIKLNVYNQNDKGKVMVTENQELEKEVSKDSTIDENSIATEDIKKDKSKNIFELSYTTDKKLEEFEINDFIKYVDTNYPKNTDTEKDKLLKDLIVLKSYRDKSEHKINNKSYYNNVFDRIISILNIVVVIILAYISQVFATFMDYKSSFIENPEANEGLIKKAMDSLEDLEIMTNFIFWIFIASIIIFIISSIRDYFNKKEKESEIQKLIIINNSIYTLEVIKEEMDKRDKEIKTKSTKDEEKVKSGN
ncbi:hypothetical protein [Peptoniphilus grossensis]|uniref:hypothetical protein n=1 Tax=Peptoniphilus grossensis TaxID=1465756 RepID=UPI0002EE0CA8|nr:hypothetical protein [Peptoniphilus grossensis]